MSCSEDMDWELNQTLICKHIATMSVDYTVSVIVANLSRKI